MMYHHAHTKQDGFSLVETLVAVSILLIVMIGPMTISVSTARSTSFSSEQVEAFFLAQEGAELAQKARDQFLLDYFDDPVANPSPWGDFIDHTSGTYALCYQAVGCGLELVDGNTAGALATPKSCLNNACLLYLDGVGGRARYTYASSGNQETIYTRTISFSKIAIDGDDDDVKVVSEVTWYSGAFRQKQSVTVETHLFNVYKTP